MEEVYDRYEYDTPPDWVEVPTAWELRQARNNTADAHTAVAGANGQLGEAQTRLDTAKRMVAEARGDYDTAATQVVAKLHTAQDAAMAGDNWWQKIYHSDAWKVIVAIVTVIVIVLAVAAMFTPLGPLLAGLLLLGGALLFADTIAAFIEGDIGPGEFGLAMALTLIPGGNGIKAGLKTLTTGARTADTAAGAARGATAVDSIRKTTQNVRVAEDGVTEITLKFKKGWSPAQIQAAIDKVTAINHAGPIRTFLQGGERQINARRIYESVFGKGAAKGFDVDHVLDLQLGGKTMIDNLQILDRSVNRSLGAQTANRLKTVAEGTPIRIFIQ